MPLVSKILSSSSRSKSALEEIPMTRHSLRFICIGGAFQI